MIRLQNLSPEDLFVLLHNVRNVFALGDPSEVPDRRTRDQGFHGPLWLDPGCRLLPDAPRCVKAFVGLLSVIEQNPGTEWRTVLSQSAIDRSADPEAVAPDEDENNRRLRRIRNVMTTWPPSNSKARDGMTQEQLRSPSIV